MKITQKRRQVEFKVWYRRRVCVYVCMWIKTGLGSAGLVPTDCLKRGNRFKAGSGCWQVELCTAIFPILFSVSFSGRQSHVTTCLHVIRSRVTRSSQGLRARMMGQFDSLFHVLSWHVVSLLIESILHRRKCLPPTSLRQLNVFPLRFFWLRLDYRCFPVRQQV